MIDLNSIQTTHEAFVQGSNKNDLKFKLKTKRISGCLIFQLSGRNVGKEKIKINSLKVLEFFLPGFKADSVLQNSWTQSGFSGYRKKVTVTKQPKMILARDFNPFSFKKEYGYLEKSLVSEWYTEISKSKNSLVIGAISVSNNFSQVFIREEKGGTRIRVTCQFDGVELMPGKNIISEKVALILGEKGAVLKKFGELLKVENSIKRLPAPIKGLCCAYYYQGNYVDEKYILEQLKAIDSLPKRLKLDVIQIDGVSSPWGDWPEAIEKHFPRGLKFIVQEIKKRGYKAGFWIPPFVASPNSKIFRKHKDWFLKDNNEKFFEARFTSPVDFLPPLSFRALDPTKPQVQNYISRYIKKLVSFGFSYIKTDFTYPVCFTVNFERKVTRAQAIRLGFETIKKSAGENVLIQSGITQLSPLVGLIDYCRTGLDTLSPFVCGVPFLGNKVNNLMLSQNLRNSVARGFLHNKIWINDPDCVVFRSGTGINETLIKKHRNFVLKEKTSRWTGDNIATLSDKQKTDLLEFFQ